MRFCFCRFFLAAIVFVLAIFWWPAMWAKWAIIAAAAILVVMGIFSRKCCCRDKEQADK